MIKYLLKCEHKHEFESWFSDSKEFEKLKKDNLVECIFCQSRKVEKSIMSPNVVGKEKVLEKNFDNKGMIAASGKVDKNILNKLLNNKFYKKKLPKSLDLKDFKKPLAYILHTLLSM